MVRHVSQSSILAVIVFAFCWLETAHSAAAESKPPDAAPDVLVLSNGDTLHGKFINAVSGNVNFHSEPLGDISIPWGNVKELHSAQTFAVLDKTVKLHGNNEEKAKQIPSGTVEVTGESIALKRESTPAPPPIPVKNAEYVVDVPTLDRQLFHDPGFLKGWSGAAGAGATVVKATQNQYTFSGTLGLVRLVPTVAWLNPRNRTTANAAGSYGKITEPGTIPVKSAIYHIDAERDQYFSPRVYALVQAAFDHNFAQNLQLQQIYGGGLGWTFLKTEQQEADLKGTVQYEKQKFITGPSSLNTDLVGSTFGLSYLLQSKHLMFVQSLEYIPAYNDTSAYSANETNTVTFPAYKNLGFSVGTIDSYLNNATFPTKRNSFQFTMGLSYAIKSKY